MPQPLNPSNNIGMVMEHGMHLPANMLGKTRGRLRSRNKSNCCTHVSGKDIEHFISQNRNAYVSMSACAEHIQFQLPHEHSHVGFLIDAIQCADAGLQATMASVKMDNGPHGLRNNFERAISHLLPYDPVAKK